MSKIDIDKFVAFEYKRQLQFTPSNAKNFFLMALDKSLEEQGLCYKDGEIIEIESKPANSFQISKDLQESDDERIRKESEDEKIRKELILFVKGNIQDEESEQRKDYLAWLEKQKPVWSEEDDEFLRRAINATKGVYPMTADWLKSIKERIKKGA